MIRIELEADTEALSALRMQDIMAAMLDEAAVAARGLAPKASGALCEAIDEFMTGADAGAIGAAVPYASFAHDGTGVFGPSGAPFTIRPQGRAALAWPGARHPVRAVTQRGIKGRSYITDALEGPALDQAIQGLIDGGN